MKLRQKKGEECDKEDNVAWRVLRNGVRRELDGWVHEQP